MSEESGGGNGSASPAPDPAPLSRQQVRDRPRNRPRSSRFEGKCEELKLFVYDATGIRGSTDLFRTTTQEIGEYIASHYDDAGEFRLGLLEGALPALAAPANPDPADPVAVEIWKMDL